MEGFLNVLKPPGMTSHDVVDYLRRLLRVKKAGHTGTLDPGASGVLPVALGKATRLVEYQMNMDKSYRFEITLGIRSDTLDAFGSLVSSQAVDVTPSQFESALSRFSGRILQVPPMVSALRHQGRRLYELAREGLVVERAPREVEIYDLQLKRFYPGEHPRAILDVSCSSGTYVRALCRDIGDSLGCGAHMSYLVRTSSGPFRLEDALALEEISQGKSSVEHMMEPLVRAVEHLEPVEIPKEQIPALAAGRAPQVNAPHRGLLRLMSPEGDLLAVGEGCNRGIRLHKVFVRG